MLRTRMFVLAAMTALFGALLVTPVQADDTNCTGLITGTHDNVKVEDGARCVISNATVEGNVQADGAGRVDIRRSVVEGNVEIKESGIVLIRSSTINGDVQLEKDLFIVVTANTIHGNLQCKENENVRRILGNIVGGNAEDQCEHEHDEDVLSIWRVRPESMQLLRQGLDGSNDVEQDVHVDVVNPGTGGGRGGNNAGGNGRGNGRSGQ